MPQMTTYIFHSPPCFSIIATKGVKLVNKILQEVDVNENTDRNNKMTTNNKEKAGDDISIILFIYWVYTYF